MRNIVILKKQQNDSNSLPNFHSDIDQQTKTDVFALFSLRMVPHVRMNLKNTFHDSLEFIVYKNVLSSKTWNQQWTTYHVYSLLQVINCQTRKEHDIKRCLLLIRPTIHLFQYWVCRSRKYPLLKISASFNGACINKCNCKMKCSYRINHIIKIVTISPFN